MDYKRVIAVSTWDMFINNNTYTRKYDYEDYIEYLYDIVLEQFYNSKKQVYYLDTKRYG